MHVTSCTSTGNLRLLADIVYTDLACTRRVIRILLLLCGLVRVENKSELLSRAHTIYEYIIFSCIFRFAKLNSRRTVDLNASFFFSFPSRTLQEKHGKWI